MTSISLAMSDRVALHVPAPAAIQDPARRCHGTQTVADGLVVPAECVRGRVDVASRLRRREEGIFRPRLPGFAPVIHCDNESSRRYTIMEVVAENALGLLYRISRVISESGCDVELVLIGTEGRRAIDVFHLSRNGAKLTVSEQQALIDNMQRVLEGRP